MRATHILVAYDVNTETREGRRRLRQVAKICLAHGQRVQKSVFECLLTDSQADELVRQAEAVMDRRRDSLRLYRLPGRGGPWRTVGPKGQEGERPGVIAL